MAADALLGNSDRLAVLSRKQKTNSKGRVTVRAAEWGLMNQANFKITATGVINTIDNDTEVVGRQLLKRLGGVTTPEAWADFLIGGGEEHLRPLGNTESATERPIPPLESLFDPGKRKLMYDALVSTVHDGGAQAHFTADSVWITKLNKIGESGRIAAINTSLQALVNTATTMENTM